MSKKKRVKIKKVKYISKLDRKKLEALENKNIFIKFRISNSQNLKLQKILRVKNLKKSEFFRDFLENYKI